MVYRERVVLAQLFVHVKTLQGPRAVLAARLLPPRHIFCHSLVGLRTRRIVVVVHVAAVVVVVVAAVLYADGREELPAVDAATTARHAHQSAVVTVVIQHTQAKTH
jgi:hypothetical protein